MTDSDDKDDRSNIIDISERNQIRKERMVGVVLFLLVCGIGYLTYKSFH